MASHTGYAYNVGLGQFEYMALMAGYALSD